VREHVSLHFYEHPETYRVHHLVAPARYRAPERRFQLDYPEDLAFFEALFRHLPAPPAISSTEEILAVLRRHPEISAINAARRHAPVA
jgi:spore coat polysaccharide biosynthesis protein SpsF (cytidylyltransferase family)